jgi:LPXTG-motif cell wall-anchored protein
MPSPVLPIGADATWAIVAVGLTLIVAAIVWLALRKSRSAR